MNEDPPKKRIMWGTPVTDKEPQAGASEAFDSPRIRSAFETKSSGMPPKRRRINTDLEPARKRAACTICNRSHRRGPCP